MDPRSLHLPAPPGQARSKFCRTDTCCGFDALICPQHHAVPRPLASGHYRRYGGSAPSRLLGNVRIKARLAERQNKAAEKTVLSKAWVLDRLNLTTRARPPASLISRSKEI